MHGKVSQNLFAHVIWQDHFGYPKQEVHIEGIDSPEIKAKIEFLEPYTKTPI